MKRIRRQIRFDIEINLPFQKQVFEWIENKRQQRKYRTTLRRALEMRFLFENDPAKGIHMLQQDFPDVYKMIAKEIISDKMDSLLARTTLMVSGTKIPTGRQASISVKQVEKEKSSKPGMNLAKAMLNL